MQLNSRNPIGFGRGTPQHPSVPDTLTVDLDSRLPLFRPQSFKGCNTKDSDIIIGTPELVIVLTPSLVLRHYNPPFSAVRCLNSPSRMVPKCFHPRCPTSSSLESISCPPLRSTASLLFTPRSASLNKTSPLSLVLAGGLVAIGILALLCTVGVGFTLYFHYCRRSDCSICSAIVRFTRSMINRSIPGSCPQGLAELLIEPLIKILQPITTALHPNKCSGKHTQKLRVTGHPLRVIECRLGHPFPPSHHLPSSTSMHYKIRRRQRQTL